MLRWWLAVVTSCVALAHSAAGPAGDADEPRTALAATRLACEWLSEPCGIVEREPRLSWIVPSGGRGRRQTAYQMLAATRADLLTPGQADLWDSGRVESGETLGIPYRGRDLQSGQRVVWRVRSWDETGAAGPWSGVASWTMGLLDPGDWRAAWIAAHDETPLHDDRDRPHLPPARQYRKVFTVAKPVRRALLHGTALGLVAWSLDGGRIGDHWFEPGWTDYRRRVPARTHDVTAWFTAGPAEHCLGATVADGWYAGYVGRGLLEGYGPHRTGRSFYGRTPAIRCQLELDYTDGSHETIATDTSWQVTDAGPVREADLLMGETYDARREMHGWDTARFAADGRWQPAIEAAAVRRIIAPFFEPGGERVVDLGFVAPAICGYTAPPIRVTGELPARSVHERLPGVFVFDMGRHFAGVVRLKVAAAAGTTIVVRSAGAIHADDRLLTRNLRHPQATDTYVCRGSTADGPETWTPRFTYHPFRFVELTGLPPDSAPPLDTVTGLVLHNDTPLESAFACSDPVLTRFAENTQWTQRTHFIEVPTTRSQRYDRLGWMGNVQLYAGTATYNADVAAFFTKWLEDVREAQADEGSDAGSYPESCPSPFPGGRPDGGFGTVWSDAGVIGPWTMWRVYGDRRILERSWESMRRFMEWRLRIDPGLQGVASGNPWGACGDAAEETPIEFIDLCAHATSARMMAEMAEALGRDAEAVGFRDRLARLRRSFAGRYLAADGTVAVATQSACALALDAGMVPERHTATVAGQLAKRLERDQFRIEAGILGIKTLLPVLSAHGHHELACRLFQSRRLPGWGDAVEHGPIAAREIRDGGPQEHGLDVAIGGDNAPVPCVGHPASGGVMEWAYRVLAGIDTGEPGSGRLLLSPRIPAADGDPGGGPLAWVRAEYAGPRGLVRSHWQRRDGGLEMRFTIPANASAVAHVPAGPDDVITEGGRPLEAGVRGVRIVSRSAADVVLDVGSGDYHFRSARTPAPISGAAEIRGPAGGSEIVITTTSRVAGAIHSLRWNGKEFIDSHDHGRQLQSASNFDVDGSFFNETFNPTEAGCERDQAGPTSTSRLLWLFAAGAELNTVNQMAFWLRPGQESGGHPATNTTALSNHLLEKNVRIGDPLLPSPAREHAIRYEVAFTVPDDERHTRGTFEVLTGYMPREFRRFHVLAGDGRLVPLSDGPGEQAFPVVVSTADGNHAMGAWSPSHAETTGKPATYGRFWFAPAGVSKWNCVVREAAAPAAFLRPGIHRHVIWVAVGTSEQVRDTLAMLRARGSRSPAD